MKKFNFSVDLINDSILKSLLIFSIPILVSNIFQQLYNMADIAIVGHTLGDNSLAAIGASAAIFELIFGFALGIGNGLSMVTARNYGANNKKSFEKVCGWLDCYWNLDYCGSNDFITVYSYAAVKNLAYA